MARFERDARRSISRSQSLARNANRSNLLLQLPRADQAYSTVYTYDIFFSNLRIRQCEFGRLEMRAFMNAKFLQLTYFDVLSADLSQFRFAVLENGLETEIAITNAYFGANVKQ